MKTLLTIFAFFMFCRIGIAGELLSTSFEESQSGVGSWGGASVDNTGGRGGTKAAKVGYSSAGVNAGVSLDVSSHNVGELYIMFYAKVDCGAGICAGGTKFLKLFSKNNGGYANSTMRLVYETGNIEGIAAGNGSTTQNDDGNVMFLDGTATWSPEVNMNTSEVTYAGKNYTGHKDGGWHCYEMYMKFNTDGNSDGEYKIWIDGVYKLHATNVKNRNDANIREFDYITLGGYSSAPQWTAPFTVWFDDVSISSSSRIGDGQRFRNVRIGEVEP